MTPPDVMKIIYMRPVSGGHRKFLRAAVGAPVKRRPHRFVFYLN